MCELGGRVSARPRARPTDGRTMNKPNPVKYLGNCPLVASPFLTTNNARPELCFSLDQYDRRLWRRWWRSDARLHAAAAELDGAGREKRYLHMLR